MVITASCIFPWDPISSFVLDLPRSDSFIGQFFWETWCICEAKEALKYPRVPLLFCSKDSAFLPQSYPSAISYHGLVETSHMQFQFSFQHRPSLQKLGWGWGREGLSHPSRVLFTFYFWMTRTALTNTSTHRLLHFSFL